MIRIFPATDAERADRRHARMRLQWLLRHPVSLALSMHLDHVLPPSPPSPTAPGEATQAGSGGAT